VNPLLAQRRSLLAYLAFWAVLAKFPWILVRSEHSLAGGLLAETTTLGFALLTLPTWYLCRALPLLPSRMFTVLGVHLVAATAWSLAYFVMSKAFVEVLALVPAWQALPLEVDRATGALLGVGALFYLLVASFHYVLAELEQRREAVEREGLMALHAQRAELFALRAQVHPHFLFNSLNTVSALIGYDAAKAREACLLLAEYLRGTLRAQERSLVRLGDEWALSERYLKVEQLRLGERLRVEVAIADAAAACVIPSLLLQPLVENAITHGVARIDEPEPVRIRAERRGERLAIELENGLDPLPPRRDGGLGLANVRARLAAEYGSDAVLRIEREDRRFKLVLDLPARPGEGSGTS
jgi:two-component system, LytTR family, sensor histidine kinase AlgZ